MQSLQAIVVELWRKVVSFPQLHTKTMTKSEYSTYQQQRYGSCWLSTLLSTLAALDCPCYVPHVLLRQSQYVPIDVPVRLELLTHFYRLRRVCLSILDRTSFHIVRLPLFHSTVPENDKSNRAATMESSVLPRVGKVLAKGGSSKVENFLDKFGWVFYKAGS